MNKSLENTTITLQKGLEQFYETHQENLSHLDCNLPKDVKDFFKSHDIAHVIFGCDISLYGEGSVKVWTVFGTTLGFWKHISEYNKANAFDLSKKLPFTTVLKDFFKLLISIPLLVIRAKKMNKRWPWKGFENYLETPIHEIRKEFNIRVL